MYEWLMVNTGWLVSCRILPSFLRKENFVAGGYPTSTRVQFRVKLALTNTLEDEPTNTGVEGGSKIEKAWVSSTNIVFV